MTRETPDLRQMAGHHCCSGCDASGHCTHGTETWYEGYDRGVRNTTEILAALATPEPAPVVLPSVETMAEWLRAGYAADEATSEGNSFASRKGHTFVALRLLTNLALLSATPDEEEAP